MRWPLSACFLALSSASAAVIYPLPRSQARPTTENITDRPAGYSPRLGPSNADCTRKDYPITFNGSSVKFPKSQDSDTQVALTKLLQRFVLDRQEFDSAYMVESGKTLQFTHNLTGTLCVPKANVTVPGVQLLIHGLGFDSSYWDFSLDGKSDNYSYVSAAAAAGLTTFRYDRLGTGLSEHPAAVYEEVQAATELDIAIQFANFLRNDRFEGFNFTKVVGVGHGYGAAQLQALSSNNPDLLDAVLLQGFSPYSPGMNAFVSAGGYAPATVAAPNRFASQNLSSAYLLSANAASSQFSYFAYSGSNFEDSALKRVFETTQPVTASILFTQSMLLRNATNFTGPVHLMIGAEDLPYCAGNCSYVPPDERGSYDTIPASMQDFYPRSCNFSLSIIEDTGHAMNTHLSAQRVYDEMVQYVVQVLSSGRGLSSQPCSATSTLSASSTVASASSGAVASATASSTFAVSTFSSSTFLSSTFLSSAFSSSAISTSPAITSPVIMSPTTSSTGSALTASTPASSTHTLSSLPTSTSESATSTQQPSTSANAPSSSSPPTTITSMAALSSSVPSSSSQGGVTSINHNIF